MPRKSHKARKRRRPIAHPYVLTPRRMKAGEKRMLADFVKTLPLTAKLAEAKKFRSKQGAYKFLSRHPATRKKLQVKHIDAAAA